MPVGDNASVEPPTLMHAFRQATHDPDLRDKGKSAASILQSVKEQEAQFEHLTRELEAERRSVAYQLERCKLSRDPPTMFNSPSVEKSSPAGHWPPAHDKDLAAHGGDEMSGSHLVDSCIPYSVGYYSGEPQEHDGGAYPSYHHPPTSTNGHPLDRDNPSPNSSQLSMHSGGGGGGGTGSNGHPQLISRTTARHSTQQVTTVTKVIREREIRHIGPDGQPVNYPYGGIVPPPPADYVPYSYNALHDPPRSDYGTYDSGQPPSPGAQEPSHAQDYMPYSLRPHSPGSETGSRRNYDPYTSSPHRGGYPEYEPYGRTPSHAGEYPPYARQDHPPPPPQGAYPSYGNYAAMGGEAPEQMPTPPSPTSEGSESPPPQQAMPQAPSGMDYNHHPPPYQPSGYDELDASMMSRPPPSEHPEHFRGTPSPGGGSDRFGPSGYLDNKPSYAEQSPGPGLYGSAPRAVFDEDMTPQDEQPQSNPLEDYPIRPHRSPSVDSETREVRWRDPDLPEVIEFLGHPNNVIKANAAAYLQHLCYMDDNTKQKTRSLGGVPPLIALLNHEIPEVHRNACGALRNLSYGRQNDENKRAIKNAGGIPALIRLLRKTPDNEVRELVTGVLWNLSSCEDIKKPIIDDGLVVITNNVIIPHSGWDRNMDNSESHRPVEIYWSTVFRNASGVLRNVSSAGEYSRKKLRECDGLVDALLYLVRAAIGKNDIDNKSVENCVCVLRNLSYRCQEVEDPNYDKHVPQAQSRASAPSKVADNLGCFGGSKKKKEGQVPEKQKRETAPSGASPHPRTEPVKGMELLWQPEVVQPYLALLSDCSNPETLEASAGAIQNLAACYWQPSIDIRAAVRKEKGLPILVELLRMEVDRVVCAVATALRNLALDQRNKELIGKYAMRDLVQKLPNETQQHDSGTSDETIAAVLATLNEVIRKNAEFARSLLEAGGIDRLMYITRQRLKFSSKVVKFASQVLYNLWQHQELREVYKKHGWRESNFVTRTMAARSISPSNVNSTLNRPISSQGGTKYEDRTIQRSRELNPGAGKSPEMRTYARGEDVPLSDMKYPSEQQPPPPAVIRPPAKSSNEPVYAQVNRDKKKNRPYENPHGGGGGGGSGDTWDYDGSHIKSASIMDPDAQAGGDSWV